MNDSISYVLVIFKYIKEYSLYRITFIITNYFTEEKKTKFVERLQPILEKTVIQIFINVLASICVGNLK